MFYTIPGKKFSKSMTQDHTGAVINTVISESLLRQTPIYRWLNSFDAAGIWNIFSKIYPALINPDKKDIKLPTLMFFEYIDVTVTIHHTDTVSIAISCSFRPIVIDIPDILQLCEALT